MTGVASDRAPRIEDLRWRRLAGWAAVAVAVFVSLAILRIPVQVTDSLVPMLQMQQAPSLTQVFASTVSGGGYMRPLYWIEVKALLDLAPNAPTLVFKTVHVGLVALLFACLVSIARVRTRDDFLAFAFSLAVVTGMHTFLGTAWEAYPVNHYLQVAVCAVGALVLAQAPHRWWSDVLAVCLFAGAALVLESGLLVWVVFAAAWLTGLRGVSGRGLLIVTALLAAYLGLRFWFLEVGTPGLLERRTGFGFRRLDTGELVERFGSRPHVLYFHNVAVSMLSVLFSEPKDGRWDIVGAWLDGRLLPSTLHVAGAALTTGLIIRFAVARRRVWAAREFDRDDRLVLIFVAVAAANAALCFAYTKSDILSTAGVFYALAAFAAARHALAGTPSLRLAVSSRPAVVLALALAAGTWGYRTVGFHTRMAFAAFDVRQDWTNVYERLSTRGTELTSPEAIALVERLRGDAIGDRPASDYEPPRWHRWFSY